jgi:hypothetical protein
MYMHLKVYLTSTDCQVMAFTEHCGRPAGEWNCDPTNS